MDRRSWFGSVVAFLTSLLGWRRIGGSGAIPLDGTGVFVDVCGKNHGTLCGFGHATLLVTRHTSPHFHGRAICEDRVYDRVLTTAEIEAIAADADAGYPETLNRVGEHS